jgi:hypothetical protein
MSEVGKTLTSESDAFDEALKPYENDARVAAAVNTFSNEGHAIRPWPNITNSDRAHLRKQSHLLGLELHLGLRSEHRNNIR